MHITFLKTKTDRRTSAPFTLMRTIARCRIGFLFACSYPGWRWSVVAGFGTAHCRVLASSVPKSLFTPLVKSWFDSFSTKKHHYTYCAINQAYEPRGAKILEPSNSILFSASLLFIYLLLYIFLNIIIAPKIILVSIYFLSWLYTGVLLVNRQRIISSGDALFWPALTACILSLSRV